jgi:hypothetical protein
MRSVKESALLVLCLSGCAAVAPGGQSQINLDQLKRDSAILDGKPVRVAGFASWPMSGAYLFPDQASAKAEEFFGGVDVVLSRRGEAHQKELEVGRCALITGTFIAFDEDTIGMGNLRSDIGMIEEGEVEFVDCPREATR